MGAEADTVGGAHCVASVRVVDLSKRQVNEPDAESTGEYRRVGIISAVRHGVDDSCLRSTPFEF
jgi:hypothetical protein